MSCLSITVTPLQPALLAVEPVAGAEMKVTPAPAAEMAVRPLPGAALTVVPVGDAVLKIIPTDAATLTIGEVCSVTPGTIVVLAASDGPLRTKNGGYLLLNPATNPPED